jgi:hypothetical protein
MGDLEIVFRIGLGDSSDVNDGRGDFRSPEVGGDSKDTRSSPASSCACCSWCCCCSCCWNCLDDVYLRCGGNSKTLPLSVDEVDAGAGVWRAGDDEVFIDVLLIRLEFSALSKGLSILVFSEVMRNTKLSTFFC